MNCTTDHIGHGFSDRSSTGAADFSLASTCGHCLTSIQQHSITRKKNRNAKKWGGELMKQLRCQKRGSGNPQWGNTEAFGHQ